MSDLLKHELNQVGWSGESLIEAGADALYEAAVSLSKAIGSEIFLQIMAEENGDADTAAKEAEIIERLKNNLRRIVRIHLNNRSGNVEG